VLLHVTCGGARHINSHSSASSTTPCCCCCSVTTICQRLLWRNNMLLHV
jgi:hypothetical protein